MDIQEIENALTEKNVDPSIIEDILTSLKKNNEVVIPQSSVEEVLREKLYSTNNWEDRARIMAKIISNQL